MRILYAALRHDPRDPILSSGVDHGFYNAIRSHAAEVEILGPFTQPPPLIERGLRRLYRTLTQRRYIKWDFYTIWKASRSLNAAVSQYKPDAVFTIFPAPLAQYNSDIPAVFTTDLTFQAWQAHGAGYGRAALAFLVWLEGQAVTRSARVIVHSQWGKDEIMRRHNTDPSKIEILPMPAALPLNAIPETIDPQKRKMLEHPLRLLLVGRDYHRKGIDIALDVAAELNSQGLPTELTICGVDGDDQEHARFVGPYKKTDPEQLKQYVALYDRAHILIHPARFEPAGIVPGEAAAFGTPTITNDTGGLGTTVAHGVSGIVLPKDSPAQTYVDAIIDLVGDPDRYYALCATTRRRYEKELNWAAAGTRVASILSEAIVEPRVMSRDGATN